MFNLMQFVSVSIQPNTEAMHCKSVAGAFLIAMAACDVQKFVQAARKQRAAT